MTLDPDCGNGCLSRAGAKQKKGPMLQVPSTIMVGVGRKKFVTPSVHPSIGGNFGITKSKHIEQTTAKVSHTCHEIW